MKHELKMIKFVFWIIPIVAILYFLPFSFFVDVQSVKYHDMCAGSDSQLVTAKRDVKWSSGYKGSVSGELFKFEGQQKIETVIRRQIDFVYQVSIQPVTYEIVWSQPIEEVGLYGASDLVEIFPPLFTKKQSFSENDQKFNVIEC